MQLIKITERIRLKVIRLALRIKRKTPKSNILIFSDTRGGSTWLLELLMQMPRTAVIWEPFHTKNGIVPASFNFGWRPYIPEMIERDDFFDFFKNLLSVKHINKWITSRSKVIDFIKSDILIFKFVRMNSMLPWLNKNFSFQYKPIYLLRHPVAVSLSQIKAFHKDNKFARYEIPNVLYNEKYLIHKDFLSTLKTPLEKYIADWCLHNKETIHHERAGKDWLVVYYENLLTEPVKELNRIFNELKINIPLNILQNIRQPSQMVYKDDFLIDNKKQLNKWRDRVTPNELKQGERILQYFQIKNYSCFNSMPLNS